METLSQKRIKMIPTKPRVFSLDEVSYHADMSSCWIVIKDKVYDVTNFLDEVTRISLCVLGEIRSL